MISDGTTNFLSILSPQGKSGARYFPPEWKKAGAEGRINDKSVQSWFQRVVGKFMEGDPGRCTVDDDIAMMACVKWENQYELTYASVHVIIVIDGTVEEYCYNEPCRIQYFRLDFDPSKPGPMFKESLPHIHCLPDGEPRFDIPVTGNIIVDFVEFIYRNYRYQDWVRWARQDWQAHVSSLGPVNQKQQFEVFDAIARAYDSGDIQSLYKKYKDPINDIKNCLRRSKDQFKLRAPDTALNGLSYRS